MTKAMKPMTRREQEMFDRLNVWKCLRYENPDSQTIMDRLVNRGLVVKEGPWDYKLSKTAK